MDAVASGALGFVQQRVGATDQLFVVRQPRAFGHAGAHCQIAWADPETGISFSFLKNGLQADMIADAVVVIPVTDAAAALRCRGSGSPALTWPGGRASGGPR